MGWCSGTEVFDKMAEYVLHQNGDWIAKRNILKILAEALEDNDWDCQSDSAYYDNPIVRLVFRELHPDWFIEKG